MASFLRETGDGVKLCKVYVCVLKWFLLLLLSKFLMSGEKGSRVLIQYTGKQRAKCVGRLIVGIPGARVCCARNKRVKWRRKLFFELISTLIQLEKFFRWIKRRDRHISALICCCFDRDWEQSFRARIWNCFFVKFLLSSLAQKAFPESQHKGGVNLIASCLRTFSAFPWRNHFRYQSCPLFRSFHSVA